MGGRHEADSAAAHSRSLPPRQRNHSRKSRVGAAVCGDREEDRHEDQAATAQGI